MGCSFCLHPIFKKLAVNFFKINLTKQFIIFNKFKIINANLNKIVTIKRKNKIYLEKKDLTTTFDKWFVKCHVL